MAGRGAGGCHEQVQVVPLGTEQFVAEEPGRVGDTGHDAFQFYIARGDLDAIDRSAQFVRALRPRLEAALTDQLFPRDG